MLDGMTVVVTGANGEVGSIVTRSCSAVAVGCAPPSVRQRTSGQTACPTLSARSLRARSRRLDPAGHVRGRATVQLAGDMHRAGGSTASRTTPDEEYAKLTPYAQNQVVAARAARKLRKLEVRSAADLRNEKGQRRRVWGGRRGPHAPRPETEWDKSRGDDAGGRLLEEAGAVLRVPAAARQPRPGGVRGRGLGGRGRRGVPGAGAVQSLARERPKPDRPLAFILLSGRSTAGDGAFVERKRESEAAFTRVASTADWSGSSSRACRPSTRSATTPARGSSARATPSRRPAPCSCRRSPAPSPRSTRRRATSARVVADALVDAELRGLGVAAPR